MTEATISIEDISLNPGKIAKLIHISGQLDESNIDEKIKEIYNLIEQNPKGLSLVFDLTNLDYMNSKSIGYLTDIYGKITENGGSIAIGQAKPNIIDILQVVGLTQLIQTFDTIEEAKAHISNSPSSTPTTSAATPAAQVSETTPEVMTSSANTATPINSDIQIQPQPAPATETTQAPLPQTPAENPAQPYNIPPNTING